MTGGGYDAQGTERHTHQPLRLNQRPTADPDTPSSDLRRDDARVLLAAMDAPAPGTVRRRRREEVDAVAVQVAAGAVVVLGGPRVGVAGEDLGIAQRHVCIQGVGDGGVPK